MEIIIALLSLSFVITVVTMYSAFAWGYVASVVYQWFILPQFNDLPQIEWWQFAGIMFLVNCFVHSSTHYFKDEVKDPKNGAITSLLSPWILMASAWVFKIIIL
jgi:hypothetical protein